MDTPVPYSERVRHIDKYILPQLLKSLLTRKVVRTQHDIYYRQCNRCTKWKPFTDEHWTLHQNRGRNAYKTQGRCRHCLNEISTDRYREEVKRLGKKTVDKPDRTVTVNGFTYYPLSDR